MENSLPPIPVKRYFTIGEVGDLCGVKPHVLRYWEQEFTQLRPMKRRGNRRYYQHHEVLMIRRIRDLLYDQGFTISGARNKMQEFLQPGHDKSHHDEVFPDEVDEVDVIAVTDSRLSDPVDSLTTPGTDAMANFWLQVRRELDQIRELLAEGAIQNDAVSFSC